MVSLLEKVRKVAQPLSTSIVQPIFKSMIQSIALKFIKPKCGRFTITREWFKQSMKQMLDLLCDNYFYKKISTILICSRLQHGIRLLI
jgi:hypothetical protein